MLKTDQLESLRCPVTGGKLNWLNAEALAQLREAVLAGELVNRGGRLVIGPPDAALVCNEAGLVYLCRDKIPVLLADEAIAIGQLSMPFES